MNFVDQSIYLDMILSTAVQKMRLNVCKKSKEEIWQTVGSLQNIFVLKQFSDFRFESSNSNLIRSMSDATTILAREKSSWLFLFARVPRTQTSMSADMDANTDIENTQGQQRKNIDVKWIDADKGTDTVWIYSETNANTEKIENIIIQIGLRRSRSYCNGELI